MFNDYLNRVVKRAVNKVLNGRCENVNVRNVGECFAYVIFMKIIAGSIFHMMRYNFSNYCCIANVILIVFYDPV